MTRGAPAAIDQAIDALLAACDAGAMPDRETVEHVLTSGYAEALDLEAERLHLMRRIQRDEPIPAADMRRLRSDLALVTDRLRALRRRLSAVDERVTGIRPSPHQL